MASRKGWISLPELTMHYTVICIGTIIAICIPYAWNALAKINDLSRSDLAAWVQAVGSILALAVAIGVTWYQQFSARRDRERGEAETILVQRARIAAAVRQEIASADEILDARMVGIRGALEFVGKAKAVGAPLRPFTISGESFRITDGVIYRAAAAELGIFPQALLGPIIDYYSRVSELERLASSPGDGITGYQIAAGMIPRVRCTGSMLRMKIDKYEASGWKADAPQAFALSMDEVRAAAHAAEYPIEKVASERGVEL